MVVAPWHAVLTDAQRSLITFGLVVTGLALVAMLVRTWIVRAEIGSRYRPAVAASLAVLSVAALSYLLLFLRFDSGYRWSGSVWVPSHDAVWAWSARYMDWAVTVPLLVVELVSVSTLYGKTMARIRAAGVTAAFAMIATGYLGGVVIGGGEDSGALLWWGVASSVCFAAVYALVLMTVLRSLPALPSIARPAYRAALVLLMVTWFIYPIVFGLQGFTTGGAWAVTGQLLLCAADVAAKVGYGLLLQRVAKLRTAFDVQAGLVTHPETLWVDGLRQSDAMLPSFADEPPTSFKDPADVTPARPGRG